MPPRPQLHSVHDVLDAVRDIAVEEGPRAVGMRAIAERSGAPSGSLYHRFGSRDELVAQAWLRAVGRFRDGYLPALGADDPVAAVRDALTWAVAFSHRCPADTLLLLANGRRDLLDGQPSPETARALEAVNGPLREALEGLAVRAFGTSSRQAVERVTHAVIDLPLAVMRRHASAGAGLDDDDLASLQASAAALLQAELVTED